MTDFTALDARIRELIEAGSFPSATLCLLRHGKIIHEGAYGVADPERGALANLDTRYDIASLSKLFASTVFMKLVDDGVFSLDEPVSKSFPQFVGMRDITAAANALVENPDPAILGQCDAGRVTWRNVLIHNSGMGWTQLQKNATPELGIEKILTMPFAYETGSTVLYTDLGLILMGQAMEKRTGKKLDTLLSEIVCKPLGLNAGYFRASKGAVTENVAPTEICQWRGKRCHGFVHDENSYFLDGVAGHAGVFATARDVALLGQAYLDVLDGKQGLLPEKTVREMVTFQQQNDWDRRGIAFQLRIIDVGAHSFPLSRTAFGHTGFTGTCMWVDPERDITFALLTNDVYNGRQNRTLGTLRKSIVERIVEAVDNI